MTKDPASSALFGTGLQAGLVRGPVFLSVTWTKTSIRGAVVRIKSDCKVALSFVPATSARD